MGLGSVCRLAGSPGVCDLLSLELWEQAGAVFPSRPQLQHGAQGCKGRVQGEPPGDRLPVSLDD